MVRIVGKITRADLEEMQRRGMHPKDAVDATLAEAKARFPRATSIHIVKSSAHDGFDIVDL